MAPIIHDTREWLEDNKKFFVPPICNKLMYKDGQLKTFFVGGPNSRKDFHMEEGEEFFYMLKGDMKLVVVEQGKFKEIPIREGEVFLLPARIPHSPQRIANTVGLVIERERSSNENDCLRYYVENSTEILYEKWFYCESLEKLGPLIKEYFSSEQYRTGRPLPGTILDDKPIKQDFQRKLEAPFSLKEFLKDNEDAINTEGKKKLFHDEYVSRIYILGNGLHVPDIDIPETFLWQIEGTAVIIVGDHTYKLHENETALIPSGEKYVLKNENRGKTLSVVMNVV